ncbi:Poly(3-hydroxyalkanoate) polymerase subunit PhaC [Paraburkholderia caffeinitolerans]|uniref:Poly(3-hydroxyalkanoate) polymerase subunit PhaC n=1 Tax=Paraburkholderia caffeinitolerans TaxID=1723730 RepID=A0A6J5G9E8_9BURK|nr:alpha/beta fold hydrolase [Paraburkholderia caffeinitolerans]CAB3793209.1 Poly(3-hydroxyalkanoate) polymerase subunit PhaC [Paraburkholderia caffeinitolerans]
MASQSTGKQSANLGLTERLQLEVERAVQRGLKSMEMLGASTPSVGRTPKTVLHRRGTLELVHYRPVVDEVYRVPLLVVMAPTNKGYILDLAPGQSLVGFLLERGYDVYLIDWNAPTDDERDLKIDDYVLDFIPDCIRRVQQDSGEHDVTLLGYCAGGMLSAIYQSLHVDGPVKNLVCMTTPVDFSKMELFRSLADEQSFDVDRFVDGVGVVPADFVLAGFDVLRPASRIAGQVRLWDNLWNDQFVKGYRMMERWGNETLPLPGGYFRQTTRELLQKNALYESTLRIGGRLVDLGKITVPLLHIVAQYDHIVPPECARPLVERVGSLDKEEVVLPGGHVSIAAGANAVKRMWPKLDSWLEGRSI